MFPCHQAWQVKHRGEFQQSARRADRQVGAEHDGGAETIRGRCLIQGRQDLVREEPPRHGQEPRDPIAAKETWKSAVTSKNMAKYNSSLC